MSVKDYAIIAAIAFAACYIFDGTRPKAAQSSYVNAANKAVA